MSYLSKPTDDGVYRIKVLNQDLYIESVPVFNAGLKLSPLSTSNSKQKWNLKKVAGKTDVWTITSAENQWGVTSIVAQDRYWGYGYPYPQNGNSLNWSILERTSQNQKFSKIKHEGNSNCFDSVSPNSDAVHFYYDKDLSSGPKQCYVFEPVKPSPEASLDVLFLQDFTGSQAPYIESARKGIWDICNTLIKEGRFAPSNLRFGLVAFRDHPPQDTTFVTKVFPFNTDPGSLADNFASLTATGGGDGPECQSDAMADALNAKWNDKATKVAILVTDSPPHGIGEDGDGFPNGCPAQINPLRIASRMASVGITLYVLACEPTLSQYYKYARDFYVGVTKRTGGKVFDLGDPAILPILVSGSAVEALDSENLVAKYGAKVRSLAQDNKLAPAAIAQQLHTEFKAEGVQQRVLVYDSMHVQSATGDSNADVWFNAETLADARSKIKENQENRINDNFLAGFSQTAPAIESKPIALAQVESLVQKSLMRT